MSGTTREESQRRIRAALQRCADALIDADASEEVLRMTADAAEGYASRFEQAEGSQRLWGWIGSQKADIRGTLILGTADAPAPIRASTVGDTAEAVVTVPPRYEGPAGSVHGGHIAWLFDEICAAAQGVNTTRRAKTATLNIRYLRPAPLGVPLSLWARVAATDDRRVGVAAELRYGETVCATADAEFTQFTQSGERVKSGSPSSSAAGEGAGG